MSAAKPSPLKPLKPSIWNWPVGRLWGVPVFVNVSVVFILWMLAFVNWQIALLAAGIYGSMMVHEAAHLRVALRCGVGVHDVWLTALFGAMRPKETATPREELQIIVAGPLVNAAIAAACLIANEIGAPLWVTELGWANLVLLALYNLLPAMPFDGGRLVRAAIRLRTGCSRNADVAVARTSVYSAAFLVVFAQWSDFFPAPYLTAGIMLIGAVGSFMCEAEIVNTLPRTAPRDT